MKKIGLLVMALVLALGLLGAAFAMWSDTLTITETVNTGEVKVGVRDVGTNDNGVVDIPTWDDEDDDRAPQIYDKWGAESSADPNACGPNPTRENKDVAKTTSEDITFYFEKEVRGVLVNFYEACSDTLANVYPSYSPSIILQIANGGTIPVMLKIVSFGVVESGPVGLDPFVDVSWNLTLVEAGCADIPLGSGSGFAALNAALEGQQIDPCQVIEIELCKHILQEVNTTECPMDESVTYTLTVEAQQWNEYS